MAYITLEQAKQHLNVEECNHEDDQYITDLIGVAESVLEKDICHALKDYADDSEALTPPLQQAALLLIGNYYSNREPVAFAASSEVPLSYRHLVQLFFDYTG